VDVIADFVRKQLGVLEVQMTGFEHGKGSPGLMRAG
jgi:hypothetical protein